MVDTTVRRGTAISRNIVTLTPTIPAAQYLRMSNEDQQYSLENQAAAIKEYAERSGFVVAKTYEDASRTGLGLKQRAGLRKLLNDVLSGDAAYSAILVYDVSRWGEVSGFYKSIVGWIDVFVFVPAGKSRKRSCGYFTQCSPNTANLLCFAYWILLIIELRKCCWSPALTESEYSPSGEITLGSRGTPLEHVSDFYEQALRSIPFRAPS